jgi:hypothetical protein
MLHACRMSSEEHFWVWCTKCERAWLVTSVRCPTRDSDAVGVWELRAYEWARARALHWPAVPEVGQYLPAKEMMPEAAFQAEAQRQRGLSPPTDGGANVFPLARHENTALAHLRVRPWWGERD